jgi:hypothetical protein
MSSGQEVNMKDYLHLEYQQIQTRQNCSAIDKNNLDQSHRKLM